MDTKQTLTLFIEPERAGMYFTLPFTMPPDVETFTLAYSYERHHEAQQGTFTSRTEINIIDLGLVGPDGAQVGASGSDKPQIFVSETQSTPGYKPRPLTPGEWGIIVGAYKIAPGGMTVTYELTFTPKRLRLLKGDLHTHTLASDGVLTAEELGMRALRHGLDFLAITDHNQMVTRDALPKIPGVTLIPGMEWTHFSGHANFLGSEKPYDEPFYTNTPEEVRARFDSACTRGALISINHPFEDCCVFKFDMNALPFDCLEIWNGPMRESNLRALGLWQSMLAAGRKVPIIGGSDYHRDTPFIFVGGPTTCVYAMSSGESDILAALRQGHAFITFAPGGPTLAMTAGQAMLGDSVRWPDVRAVEIAAEVLQAGDIVRVVNIKGSEDIFRAPAAGRFQSTYPVDAPGFVRVEVWRSFLPGIPPLPSLIANPIYFDAA